MAKLASERRAVFDEEVFVSKLDMNKIQQMPSAIFRLSWSHYQILMRIENESERNFYEIESERQQWSVEQLKRQYHSSLYERKLQEWIEEFEDSKND